MEAPKENKLMAAGLIFIIAGIIILLLNIGMQGGPLWRAVLVNFVFFVSLSAGLVVWPAVIQASNGEWSRPVDNIALAAFSFAVPSIAVLLLLWIASPHWAPWYNNPGKNPVWLNNNFLFIRDIIALIIFWILSFLYLRNRNKLTARKYAGILIVSYCLIFSLLGYDLIMALTITWGSALLGAYFFISGLYIGAAGWGLLSILSGTASKQNRVDIGNIVLSFCVLTFYFLFSQLIVLWYENLPHETSNLVQRLNITSWHYVSYILLAVVYMGPVIYLLPRVSKTNKWYFGFASLLILAGMWVERWWLVDAVFQDNLNYGFGEASITLIFLGVFTLGTALSYRKGWLIYEQ